MMKIIGHTNGGDVIVELSPGEHAALSRLVKLGGDAHHVGDPLTWSKLSYAEIETWVCAAFNYISTKAALETIIENANSCLALLEEGRGNA